MRNVVIVSGARTPIGKFGGAFKTFKASELGSAAIKAAVQRAGIQPSSVDDVYMGNVLQAAEAGYVARLASLGAGIPDTVPAVSINRLCSSGLEAINMAAHAIIAGEAEICVAGGTENMSQTPYLAKNIRWDGLRMGDAALSDGLIEGLSCPVHHYHMGVTAENIAEKFGVNRHDQDELSVLSHQRAVAAMEGGRLKKQLIAIDVPQRRGNPVQVTADENPRKDTTMESLAGLRPAFKKDGSITAGNASSINDAAAAVVVMSEDKARELGLTPKLRWVGRAVAGVDPAFMGTGPVPAVRRVLDRTGMSLDDMDLIELNEAFAAQALYCIRELGLDLDKTNVQGSGIAMGHPVGATGAIMTLRLMEELTLRDKEYGLATMCIGGGQGCATIFQRVG